MRRPLLAFALLALAMLAQARGYDALVETDIATWHPAERPALIFSNAALQWLGRHAQLMPHLARQRCHSRRKYPR